MADRLADDGELRHLSGQALEQGLLDHGLHHAPVLRGPPLLLRAGRGVHLRAARSRRKYHQTSRGTAQVGALSMAQK